MLGMQAINQPPKDVGTVTVSPGVTNVSAKVQEDQLSDCLQEAADRDNKMDANEGLVQSKLNIPDSGSTSSDNSSSSPVVTEPAVTEPAVTEPAVKEPAVIEPVVKEPAIIDLAVTEPAVTEPAVTEPADTEPAVTEPAVTEPAVTDPCLIRRQDNPPLDEKKIIKAQPNSLYSNTIFDEETDSESDSDTEAVFVKRSRGRATLLSEDDEDNEDNLPAKTNQEGQYREEKSNDAEENIEHTENLFKSDLFDADSDSDIDREKEKKSLKRVRKTILSDDEDEEDDKEEAISKKKTLLEGEDESDSEQVSGSDGETSSKRLIPEKYDDHLEGDEEGSNVSEKEKTSSKASRIQKPRRLKKEALQKIHSESQRLIRESAFHLPYHKPKQLTVDDFFNKRPSVRPLKPIRGLSRITTGEQKKQLVDVTEDGDLPDPFSSETKNTTTSPDEISNKNTVNGDCDGQNGSRKAEHVTEERESIEASTKAEDIKDGGKENTILINKTGLSTEQCLDIEEDQTETIVTKDKKEGRIGDCNTSERDGELLMATTEGVEWPNESTIKDKANKKQSTTMRLLQASLEKFKDITPKLSGETERVICFDEEQNTEAEAIPAGVENLMQRFARHSTKKSRGRKTPKEVHLSIVKKETNQEGREDLKKESISVILEPEEEEVNPKLKVPGAKLLHLKEALQQKMKERREQERQKRQEAYNIDNEEMGGEEEEEEAELSDAEMSDEDYKMEPEVDSEEDDEDFIPDDGADEHIREKNMFADDEAEDDDMEEEDDGDEDEEEINEIKEVDDHRRMTGSEPQAMTTTEKTLAEDSRVDISPHSRKTKARSKRRILLSDDEDDEGKDDYNSQIEKEIILKTTENSQLEPKELICQASPKHQESSNMSSISSKTSSIKKSDLRLVSHPLPDVGKTMDLFDSTSSLTDVKNNDLLTSDDKQMTFNLKEHLGRQDSVKTSEADNGSITSLDNSFEMFPATIPPYQPRRESIDGSDDAKSKEPFTPFSKAKISLENRSPKSTSKFPELSLPVEDSQDLFRIDTPSVLSTSDSQRETETQNFRFSFDEDETQTQFLDVNGFLKLKSSAKRPGPRRIFQSENTSQGNMDELLDLCSGQFNQEDINKVYHNENASQGNMDELLGLCSGKFTKQDDKEENSQELPSTTSFKKGLFSQMQTQDNINELIDLCSGNFSSTLDGNKDSENTKEASDKESLSSFRMVFDQETLKTELGEEKEGEDGVYSSDDEPIILKRKKRPEQDRQVEEDGDELLLTYDSNDEVEVNKSAFKGMTYSKFAKRKFFEEEAELSGSDAESDEDYDAEEEPDELELDREVEDQFKDTEKLRKEVNEIYMKTTDDEDARRLRLLKELYLQDGDLYSDKSRVRKFRWKHLDEMGLDAGAGIENNSDDEGADEDDQDTQWRLQRYQREQWLKEQDKEKSQKSHESITVQNDEDSQFDVFMKIASKNNSKGSVSSSGTSSDPATSQVTDTANKEKKEFNSPKPLKMHKHGSFLKRKKQELEKLASVVRPLVNLNGPKHNRGFIFQSLSQTNVETEKPQPTAKVKRSISVQEPSSHLSDGPKSKRPKLERSSSQMSSGSIFNHF